MSGFCLQTAHPQTPARLRLVDLASGSEAAARTFGDTTLAWSFPPGSRDCLLRQDPGRFLFIHGEPDRLPGPEESVSAWLPGRRGSFRGVEVEANGVARVFVDPWCSRQVFYSVRNGRVCVSDKLLTLSANEFGSEPDWGVLLEAMVMGPAYAGGTSVQGSIALKPGELLCIQGADCRVEGHHQIPAWDGFTEGQVRDDPADTLLKALEAAVQETWKPDAWMLLSGGLDSRLIMVLGGPGRKAMTVTDGRNRECETAEQIAAHCSAQFLHDDRDPEEHYSNVFRDAVWLTAAMYDSLHAHHLGMSSAWRARGVEAVATGYLFDVLLKGTKIAPRELPPLLNPRAAGMLGDQLVRILQVKNGRHRNVPDDVVGLLSEDGIAVAAKHFEQQVKPHFPDRPPGAVLDNLEHRLRQGIARHGHFPLWMAWMEQMPTDAPAFHPAIWQWVGWCPVEARMNAAVFRKAIFSLDHPAITEVANANTGRAVQDRSEAIKSAVRNLPGFPLVRGLRQKLFPAPARDPLQVPARSQGSWPNFASLMRTPRLRAVLEEGLAMLPVGSLVERDKAEHAYARLLAGEDRYMEPVMCAATVGRFLHILATPSIQSPWLREVSVEQKPVAPEKS